MVYSFKITIEKMSSWSFDHDALHSAIEAIMALLKFDHQTHCILIKCLPMPSFPCSSTVQIFLLLKREHENISATNLKNKERAKLFSTKCATHPPGGGGGNKMLMVQVYAADMGKFWAPEFSQQGSFLKQIFLKAKDKSLQ